MKKSKPESTALSANQMYSDFKENVNMADCISELIEEILDLTSLENASPTGSGKEFSLYKRLEFSMLRNPPRSPSNNT